MKLEIHFSWLHYPLPLQARFLGILSALSLILLTCTAEEYSSEYEKNILFVMQLAMNIPLNQFDDAVGNVFIDDIPGELPPKRGDDDHAIELILGSSPPNKPPYRVSQAQQEEIMRQVNELVEKGMVNPKESSHRDNRSKAEHERDASMIYDVNSAHFRSFLSQKGGAADRRKNEEQKPKEHKPKANENKPVMNE
ncbi:hypothetical protein L7F22_030441 [Adiantum nelumboides]|nr:hypothetical protein [Adiantum nelumboides]